ncbi:MAG: S8/S53 family peptidase [Sphingomonadales bacterium]|jgi:minor extracellular serine protease Vpr
MPNRIGFMLLMLLGWQQIFAQHEISRPVNEALSPMATLFLEEGPGRLFPPDSDGKHWITIQWKKANCIVQGTGSVYSNIQFIKADYKQFKNIAFDPCIAYCDVAGRLNSLRPLNDTARVHSRVNQVHDGLNNGLPASFKGKNVIVGIVDIGFQTNHPTFYNSDGTVYRVKRFWHQGNNSGTSPAGFTYGTEFSLPSAIQSARDDDGTHGTHVAGISSGSGFTTPLLKFRGMAPESDMVFVTIKYSNDTLQGSALGDYVVANPTIIDAYKYVFDYAASRNKPAVTNLSWGMHTGPHDGTSIFDKAVESFSGKGKIIVGANGNDAGNQMHVSALLKGDTAYTFVVDRNRRDYRSESVYCDFWGAPGEDLGLNISLFDTLGNLLVAEPFVYASGAALVRKKVVNGTDTLEYTFSCQKSYINNQKPNILVLITSSNAAKCRIRLGVTGKGTVHGWNSGQVYRWTSGSFLDRVKGNDYSGKYLSGTSAGSMSENGGTGKQTLSVGSYVNRNNWIDFSGTYRAQNWLKVGEISGFSSRGPTPDGRMKPDIGAPGQLVASAVNNKQFAPWMAESTLYQSQFNGETQYWTMFSGTSMAAPHVAGIVALMLEAKPELNLNDVRLILRATAIRDNLTGNDSNNNFGYGRINALDAVKMALSMNHTRQSGSNDKRFMLYPNPAGSVLNISNLTGNEGLVNLELFDMQGRRITQASKAIPGNGNLSVNISEISNGMYVYRLQKQDYLQTGQIIVRHP